MANVIFPTAPSAFPLQQCEQVRPWVRFWARNLDASIYFTAFLLPLAIFFVFVNSSLHYSPISLMIFKGLVTVLMLLFSVWLWIYAEAASFALLGTTPGKWLLNINVTDVNLNPPDFQTALDRAWKVTFKGYYFCLPIISLVALWKSKKNVELNGITLWDRAAGLTVTHQKIGGLRITLYLVATLIVGIVNNLLSKLVF